MLRCALLLGRPGKVLAESRHALSAGLPFSVAAPPPSRRVAGVSRRQSWLAAWPPMGRHQIWRAHPIGPVLTGGGLARRHGGCPRRRAGGSPRARQEAAPPSTSPAEPPLPRVPVRALIAPLAPEVRGGVWESGADPRGGELAGRAPEPTTSTAAAEQKTRRGRGTRAPGGVLRCSRMTHGPGFISQWVDRAAEGPPASPSIRRFPRGPATPRQKALQSCQPGALLAPLPTVFCERDTDSEASNVGTERSHIMAAVEPWARGCPRAPSQPWTKH